MNEARSTRYQRLRRRAGAAALLSGGMALGLVAFTPLATRLATAAEWTAGTRDGWHRTISLVVFCVMVVVFCELAALPVVLAAERQARRYRRRDPEAPEDTLLVLLPAMALTLVATLVAAAVVRSAVVVAGDAWWALAALALAAVLAVAMHGLPALLARLAPAAPIKDRSLRERLDRLTVKARVPVVAILAWSVDQDSSMTAVVSGTGGSRRVFLASTLVRDWSHDEIAVVVAHELAHHKYQDLWRTWGLHATVFAAGLAAAHAILRLMAPGRAVGDLQTLPVIAFVAGAVWLLSAPVRHAQSRRHERRADVFALAMTGAVAAFGNAIRRLSEQYLVETRPSRLTRFLHYRHPSVQERLALAEAYDRVRNQDVP